MVLRIIRPMLAQATRTSLVAVALLGAACSIGEPGPTAAEQEQVRARAATLIDQGYTLKQTGRNRDALAKLVEACALLERALGPAASEVASCLDDQASIHVRTGDYERARRLYYRALRTAGEAEGADPLLVSGIRYRIGLLGRLEKLSIRCSEPDQPPADAALPYFPDIEAVQRALGTLGPQVHTCASGPPRPVTLKVTITGDGRPIMAEARGTEAGTAVGKCVENRVEKAIPSAALPRFSACFRAFTYPFAVGEVPTGQPEPPVAD